MKTKQSVKVVSSKLLELQERYRQETGKRPIYNKKETKDFKVWLEKQKKLTLKKSESNRKSEIREEWELLLEKWINEANENEISKEIKEELFSIIRKYGKAKAIYWRIIQILKRKNLSIKETEELEGLLKKLEKITGVQVEIFKNLRAFRAYYNDNIRWYKNSIIAEREKFLKHLSQKLSYLKKIKKTQNVIQENWKEILKENLYKNTILTLHEKSIINQILQKEKLTEVEKKELIFILSKLPTEQLISLLGENFKKHTQNNIRWGWDFSIPIKRLILNNYFRSGSRNSISIIHTNIIQKLKHNFAQFFKKESNPENVTYKELDNIINGLSLTQIKKLKKSSKILRYETYLEYYYFIKKTYEKYINNIIQWKELERYFSQLFKIASHSTKNLPTREDIYNFFFRDLETLSWELWFDKSSVEFFNSHPIIINYWRRRLNKIAKILIEYGHKYDNIPFKAYVLKGGERKWKELKNLTDLKSINLQNIERSMLNKYNVDFRNDILNIRFLYRKYQFKYLLKNEIYDTMKFLNELIEIINDYIKKGLIRENTEVFYQNRTEKINIIYKNRITQVALSQLMGQNKEYIEKSVKSGLRYNKHYIIDYKSLEKLLENIMLIFREDSKIQKEVEFEKMKIQKLIMAYMRFNKRLYYAKREHILQSHPYLNLEYFNIIFNKKIALKKRIEAAYWLGFIFAEGYITRKNEFGINISILDKPMLYKFCLAIGANPTYIRDIITTGKEGKEYYASVIRIFNSKFCESLRNLGVLKRKSKILELPELFQNLTENDENLKKVFLAFLLGYYDGDGITNKNTFLSGSKKFVEQIQRVLEIAFKKNSQIHKYKAFRLTFNAEIKREMEENFQNSMARKRKYHKGKYGSEILGNEIINLICEYIDSIYIGDMIVIFNDIVERNKIHKILKLSLPKVKRALTYRNISIHHLEWYSKRDLNSEVEKEQFKKSLKDIIEN